ncbi:unnamed protein product [Darwinula stevensoni]|uniref:F-box domain-containing protein n=1 Tax=Darwinula stevensoni TaxID=69355 RepID=A0A7R8XCH8_9CRUS|nr:unnamed protein product [Darwinula stevensoni]CAG0887749.1 unnamed protein product [Darwinula stevensoni]
MAHVAADDSRGPCVSLLDVPREILVAIFEYLDVESLSRLARTCRTLRDVASSDVVWRGRAPLLVSLISSFNRRWIQRSRRRLGGKDLARLCQHWEWGRCSVRLVIPFPTKFEEFSVYALVVHLSREIMDKQRLQHNLLPPFSDRQWGVVVFPEAPLHPEGTHRGHCSLRPSGSAHPQRREVRPDGGICGWEADTGRFVFSRHFAHNLDVQSVDLRRQTLVSGGKGKILKVWNLNGVHLHVRQSLDLRDRIWKCLLDETGEKCALGLACTHSPHPLVLVDTNRGEVAWQEESLESRRGAGILDIVWEDPHTLLSCGYDSTVRLTDLRVGGHVSVWEDPFDSALFSLDSSRANLFVTGAALNGIVRVWDKRSSKHLQMFYMPSRHSTPVYSVACDPTVVYAAIDQGLCLLDFYQHF